MAGDRVLDSSALLAYLQGEKSGRAVANLLKEAAETERFMVLSSVHWGEVLYVLERRYGSERCDLAEQIVNRLPIEVVPVDRGLAREAARFKAAGTLSYVDAIAAALAVSRKAALVTADHDFRAVVGTCKIEWV